MVCPSFIVFDSLPRPNAHTRPFYVKVGKSVVFSEKDRDDDVAGWVDVLVEGSKEVRASRMMSIAGKFWRFANARQICIDLPRKVSDASDSRS